MAQPQPEEVALLQLSNAQQTVLLQMARDAIVQYLADGRIPQYQLDDPALAQLAGVFVTLRSNMKEGLGLRGCIGRVEAERPLLRIVPEMAVKAATSDPRFPPVAAEELPLLHIEISVLSPLQRLENPEALEIGKHGLLIEGHGRRGLLLPEVPLTHGWDRQAFLEGICQKAGLPPNAWHDPKVQLYMFTTLNFEEE
jgi:AmmeMemoRadiSam system protein A